MSMHPSVEHPNHVKNCLVSGEWHVGAWHKHHLPVIYQHHVVHREQLPLDPEGPKPSNWRSKMVLLTLKALPGHEHGGLHTGVHTYSSATEAFDLAVQKPTIQPCFENNGKVPRFARLQRDGAGFRAG